MPTVYALSALLVTLFISACGGGGGGGDSPAPPVISSTNFAVSEDTVLSGTISLSDPKGSSLQVGVPSSTSNGSLVGPSASGVFSYTPKPNFYGSDSFSITVTNASGLSTTATVSITVNNIDDAPVAAADTGLVAPGSSIVIQVLGNDQEVDGQNLTTELISQPAGGIATANSNGAILFTPANGFKGVTTFQYRAIDAGGSASAPATVTVTVNYPPVATADTKFVAPGISTAINVLGNDVDAENEALRAEIVTPPTNGTAIPNLDGSVTFTPANGFAGVTTFHYRAVDINGGASNSVPVTVDVRPLNKVVYVTAPGTDHRVVYSDPQGEHTLNSSALSADSIISFLQYSHNGRTVMWSVYSNGFSNSYFVDLSAGFTQRNTNGGILSPDGQWVLWSTPVMVGYYVSNQYNLNNLISGPTQVIHNAPGTEQISSIRFSADSKSIFYRTNLPARMDTAVTYQRVSIGQTQSPTLLWQPSGSSDTATMDFIVTPDASKLVYTAIVGGSFYQPYVSSGTQLSTPQPLGLQALPAFTTVQSLVVSPTGTHAAFSTRDTMTPPQSVVYAYVTSLDPPYTAVHFGPSFAIGTRLGAPVFNGDGTRVLLSISTESETAIYEMVLANPGIITRVTPAYPATVRISKYSYAAGGQAVYLADDVQAGCYLLYVASQGSANRLNIDTGASVFTNTSNNSFLMSPDGTTVLYAQPNTTNGPLTLYMVNVGTPGFPTIVGTNVYGPVSGSLAFDIR